MQMGPSMRMDEGGDKRREAVRRLDGLQPPPENQVRALRKIAEHLHLEDALKDLNILVIHSNGNVAAQEAFPDANVKFLEKTDDVKNRLSYNGYNAEKRDAAEYEAEQKADIVIVLDEETSVTSTMLKNIKEGGHLICLPRAGVEARMEGFRTEGGIDVTDPEPRFRSDEKAEGLVETDEELEESAENNEKYVTFEEARKALEDAGRKSDSNVVENYRKLLKEVGDALKPLPYKKRCWLVLKRIS